MIFKPTMTKVGFFCAPPYSAYHEFNYHEYDYRKYDYHKFDKMFGCLIGIKYFCGREKIIV